MSERQEQEDRAVGTAETAIELKKHRKRPLLWLAFGVLSLGLLANLVFAAFYAVNKKPFAALPVVGTLTQRTPPRFGFSIYDVSRPLGVAVSRDGQRLYVTESAGERQVRVFDGNGRPVGFLSPPDTDKGKRAPTYVALDGKGRIFVSDSTSRAVHIYSPSGEYAGRVPPPPGDTSATPLGLAFDRHGRLYVATAGVEKETHRVLVYDAQLQFKGAFGQRGNGPGELEFPNGLVVDDKDRLFVSNGNNGRVDAFSIRDQDFGQVLKADVIAGQGLPRGVALDEQNRLHVVDTTNSMVSVFGVGGDRPAQLFTFGEFGLGDGQLQYPNGVAIDQSGRVYVTDRVNDRVQVWVY
ncbi:MAG: hypothetical protein EPO21_07760 [Chloroflexota bacterium]|nr:MAG: hypothetical protein EPO21_07760 [Chloroflexota bacterium]